MAGLTLTAVVAVALLRGPGTAELRAQQPEAGQEISISVRHSLDGETWVGAGAGQYQITLTETGETRTTTPAGRVQFGGLSPGTYNLVVSKTASAPAAVVAVGASCEHGDFGGASLTIRVNVEGGEGPRNPECTVSFAPPVAPPVDAQPDTFSTCLDQTLSGDVSSNDSVGTPPGSWSLTSNPQGAHGLLSGFGPRFTYTPTSTGTDVFTYQLTDAAQQSDSATITISVTVDTCVPPPPPLLPVAEADEYTVFEGTALTEDVGSNDSFSAPASFALVGEAPARVELSRAGIFSYTPPQDFDGVEEFSYQLTDPGGSDTATIRIRVKPVPDPVDDYAETPFETPVTVDILANDELDGLEVVIEIVSGPEHGTVAILGDRVRYAPADGFDQIDTFAYRLTCGAGCVSGVANVTVVVGKPGPIANDDLKLIPDPRIRPSFSGDVSANDVVHGPAPVFELVPPQTGAGRLRLRPNGGFSYTPNGFEGVDEYRYQIVDDGQTSLPATLWVIVGGVPPEAHPDEFTVSVNGRITFDVAENDFVPREPSTFTAEPPDAGELSPTSNSDGVFTFRAPASTGVAEFDYTIGDEVGQSTAKVRIRVIAPGVPPVANDDEAEGLTGDTIEIPAGENDTFDDSALFQLSPGATGADIEMDEHSGLIRFRSDRAGTFAFAYQLIQGGFTRTAKVTVHVSEPDAIRTQLWDPTSGTWEEEVSFAPSDGATFRVQVAGGGSVTILIDRGLQLESNGWSSEPGGIVTARSDETGTTLTWIPSAAISSAGLSGSAGRSEIFIKTIVMARPGAERRSVVATLQTLGSDGATAVITPSDQVTITKMVEWWQGGARVAGPAAVIIAKVFALNEVREVSIGAPYAERVVVQPDYGTIENGTYRPNDDFPGRDRWRYLDGGAERVAVIVIGQLPERDAELKFRTDVSRLDGDVRELEIEDTVSMDLSAGEPERSIVGAHLLSYVTQARLVAEPTATADYSSRAEVLFTGDQATAKLIVAPGSPASSNVNLSVSQLVARSTHSDGTWRVGDLITVRLEARLGDALDGVTFEHRTETDFLTLESWEPQAGFALGDCQRTADGVLACIVRLTEVGDSTTPYVLDVHYRALAETEPGGTPTSVTAGGLVGETLLVGPIEGNSATLQIVDAGGGCETTCQLILVLTIGVVAGLVARQRLIVFPPCPPGGAADEPVDPIGGNPNDPLLLVLNAREGALEMHRPSCVHAGRIAAGNRREVHGSAEQVAALQDQDEVPPDLLSRLQEAGYDGCMHCLRDLHID